SGVVRVAVSRSEARRDEVFKPGLCGDVDLGWGETCLTQLGFECCKRLRHRLTRSLIGEVDDLRRVRLCQETTAKTASVVQLHNEAAGEFLLHTEVDRYRVGVGKVIVKPCRRVAVLVPDRIAVGIKEWRIRLAKRRSNGSSRKRKDCATNAWVVE